MSERVYISGPMSDKPELNMRAFFDAEDRLVRGGIKRSEILNPARFDGDTAEEAWENAQRTMEDGTYSWEACILRDISSLLTCTHVVLLDGWQYSEGARLEALIGLSRGMEVRELDSHRPILASLAAKASRDSLLGSLRWFRDGSEVAA